MIGDVKGINTEMLVTPEGSFPYYEVIQACNPPNITAVVLFECEASLLTTIIVIFAVLTRKIGRQTLKTQRKSTHLSTWIFSSLHFIPSFTDYH